VVLSLGVAEGGTPAAGEQAEGGGLSDRSAEGPVTDASQRAESAVVSVRTKR